MIRPSKPEPFQCLAQLQIALGHQQLLHQQAARAEEHLATRPNQFLGQRSQQVRLPRARSAKDQHVLAPVQERALQQGARLLHHLGRQALQVQPRQLFSSGSRDCRSSRSMRLSAAPGTPGGQPQQVLLVAQPLLLRLPRQLLVTRSERRQVQFLQVRQQALLHVLVPAHASPP